MRSPVFTIQAHHRPQYHVQSLTRPIFASTSIIHLPCALIHFDIFGQSCQDIWWGGSWRKILKGISQNRAKSYHFQAKMHGFGPWNPWSSHINDPPRTPCPDTFANFWHTHRHPSCGEFWRETWQGTRETRPINFNVLRTKICTILGRFGAIESCSADTL